MNRYKASVHLAQKLMDILVELSLKLKQFEEQHRVEIVREYIKEMNSWMKSERHAAKLDR